MTSQQQRVWQELCLKAVMEPRPEEADGDCSRTKPHTSKPEQESTRCSGKQSAKAAECLIVFSVSPPHPILDRLIKQT